MKSKFSLRKIGGLILSAILLSGIAIFSSNTAQAQYRRRVIIVPRHRFYRPYNPWRYDPFRYDRYNSFQYNQYVFDNGERAVDQGYKDGYKTGRDDGKKGKSYSAERSHYFHDAGFGNFAEAYRSGFGRGYNEGYSVGRNGEGR